MGTDTDKGTFYAYNTETGEYTEVNIIPTVLSVDDLDIEITSNFDMQDMKSIISPEGSFEFTAWVYYRSYKEYKEVHGFHKVNKNMFPKDKHGFPMVNVYCNGFYHEYRGKNAIRFIRWYNKKVVRYNNSRLHDEYIKYKLEMRKAHG